MLLGKGVIFTGQQQCMLMPWPLRQSPCPCFWEALSGINFLRAVVIVTFPWFIDWFIFNTPCSLGQLLQELRCLAEANGRVLFVAVLKVESWVLAQMAGVQAPGMLKCFSNSRDFIFYVKCCLSSILRILFLN